MESAAHAEGVDCLSPLRAHTRRRLAAGPHVVLAGTYPVGYFVVLPRRHPVF